MKLLRLKIESNAGFRSLPKGFEIYFHEKQDWNSLSSFNPFCIVGLNGCGKSNVMEALALIFFHVELCISEHLPDYIVDDQIFDPRKCIIEAFTLEYFIKNDLDHDSSQSEWSLIRISKKVGEAPVLAVFEPHLGPSKIFSVTLKDNQEENISFLRQYLPEYVVAYSSGENETLSIPFIKSRLLHLEEFKQATIGNYKTYINPENNLIYIDANMSQAILLCCLLFENEETLKSLAEYDNTGILSVRRFRMCLRSREFSDSSNKKYSYFKLLKRDLFPIFEACSTMSWYDDVCKTFYFDFYVNDATKQAFKAYFGSSMECFQIFRLLYELNYYDVSNDKIEEVIGSKGIYIEGKLSVPGAEDDIFHFLDFYVEKQIEKDRKSCDMLLRQLSDGEHQFIHTMAICILLKNADSLLLLDEPETHFNPSWRSRFVSILNETLNNACNGFEQNYKKDILITTHSPFIISDCKPENVIILEKDSKGYPKAKKASQENIMTYGASTSFIQARIFGNSDSIGGKAYQDMKNMSEQVDVDRQQLLNDVSVKFGESLEKLMILSAINDR